MDWSLYLCVIGLDAGMQYENYYYKQHGVTFTVS